MESPQINKDSEDGLAASTSTNQLFNPENLDLPDDTFRMSLDYISIAENVTIDDRESSVDTNRLVIDTSTPCNTPIEIEAKEELPILDTPKRTQTEEPKTKPQNLLKLSLTKNIDDGFVKPSPVADIMSPAKMLQFEVDITTSATPTMKRAAIDFNFFNENNFEKYFEDVPKVEKKEAASDEKAFRETPVIVKADTVRHEIGYAGNSGQEERASRDWLLCELSASARLLFVKIVDAY